MEVRKSLNRFLSIFFIVALGVAFFSGIQATAPDMRATGDYYFDSNQLMDLRVNIPLEDALDLGWEILADCFEPNETGLKSSLIAERWPDKDALK